MGGGALGGGGARGAPGAAGRGGAGGGVLPIRMHAGEGSGAMRLLWIALMTALPALGAAADQPLPLFGISPKNGSTLSVPMQIVILLPPMTLLPAAVMVSNPFLPMTVGPPFSR